MRFLAFQVYMVCGILRVLAFVVDHAETSFVLSEIQLATNTSTLNCLHNTLPQYTFKIAIAFLRFLPKTCLTNCSDNHDGLSVECARTILFFPFSTTGNSTAGTSFMCSDVGRETELTLNNWVLFCGESSPSNVLYNCGFTRRADAIYLNYKERKNGDVGSDIIWVIFTLHLVTFFMSRIRTAFVLVVSAHKRRQAPPPSCGARVRCTLPNPESRTRGTPSTRFVSLRRWDPRYASRHHDVPDDGWLVSWCLGCYPAEPCDGVSHLPFPILFLLYRVLTLWSCSELMRRFRSAVYSSWSALLLPWLRAEEQYLYRESGAFYIRGNDQ